MRWAVLIAVIVLFAYSVTLKYCPTRAYYTSQDRYNFVLFERPAYPLVVYMNTRCPDATLYQNWYDEYRAWFKCDVVGRRMWRESWEEYHSTYDNTAANLYMWLSGMGVTHFMVHPYGPFELPLWDGEFDDYFKVQTKYGDHTIYRLDTGSVQVDPDTISDSGYRDTGAPVPDSWLQE